MPFHPDSGRAMTTARASMSSLPGLSLYVVIVSIIISALEV